MNGLDILLYTLGLSAIAYTVWVLLNLAWHGMIVLYHHISDELHYRKLTRKRKN